MEKEIEKLKIQLKDIKKLMNKKVEKEVEKELEKDAEKDVENEVEKDAENEIEKEKENLYEKIIEDIKHIKKQTKEEEELFDLIEDLKKEKEQINRRSLSNMTTPLITIRPEQEQYCAKEGGCGSSIGFSELPIDNKCYILNCKNIAEKNGLCNEHILSESKSVTKVIKKCLICNNEKMNNSILCSQHNSTKYALKLIFVSFILGLIVSSYINVDKYLPYFSLINLWMINL